MSSALVFFDNDFFSDVQCSASILACFLCFYSHVRLICCAARHRRLEG